MHRLNARFRIVTPCFLGPDERRAELRLASLKGALRFWWRSLAPWGPDPGAMERMREREEALFGSPRRGQGRILLALQEMRPPGSMRKGEILKDRRPAGPGTRYLGYGLMKTEGKDAGRLRRPCLKAPCEFVLRLAAFDREALREVLPALQILGLLGGLGARSRKGYGSLNLEELAGDLKTGWRPLRDVDDYQRRLARILDPAALGREEEPPFTAFSGRSRIDLALRDRRSALEVIEGYGREMVRYRSWGRKGRILERENAERLFPEDHDWSKGRWTPRGFHPRRAVFGLPHAYRDRSVRPQRHLRRASPLFFHVHRIQGRHMGLACLLPSAFLPPGEGLRAGERNVPCRPEWKILAGFLDRFRRQEGGRTLWPHE